MGGVRVIERAAAFVLVTAAFALVLGPRGALAGTYTGFVNPQPVTINGWSATAMEPFISADGRYLLFNTSNQPPTVPALEYATRVDASTFEYAGEIADANEPGVLSGTPSMDNEDNLFFVSARSYSTTLATIYSGRFGEGALSGEQLVSGVSGGMPGIVDFDGAVSPDGNTLYVSVGRFAGGAAPESATLALYDRVSEGFAADPRSTAVLAHVNKSKWLDYAACVSADGLELFFTRANAKHPPTVYRASRKTTEKPFAKVQRVGAITGFAEAPSLSADGKTLYYHELVGSRFEIMSVTRP